MCNEKKSISFHATMQNKNEYTKLELILLLNENTLIKGKIPATFENPTTFQSPQGGS